jgi:hypothetical protein
MLIIIAHDDVTAFVITVALEPAPIRLMFLFVHEMPLLLEDDHVHEPAGM